MGGAAEAALPHSAMQDTATKTCVEIFIGPPGIANPQAAENRGLPAILAKTPNPGVEPTLPHDAWKASDKPGVATILIVAEVLT